MCLGLMHKDMAVFVHSIQLVSSFGAERVYSCTSQWFKLLLIGVYQLKPEILPNLFQQPVKSLNPQALRLFFEILALKGSVLASKRRLFASKKRLFASKTDASGHFLSLRLFSPQTFVWSVLGGIIIQSILSQPFSDLQSCDGQESVQWIRNATMVFNPKTFSFMHQCYQCFCTDWYDYVYCAGLSGKTLNESVVGI